MQLTQIAAFALSLPGVLAVPPASFGFPNSANDTSLEVYYRQADNTSYVKVQPGAKFGIEIAARRPTLALNTTRFQSLANYTGTYVVALVDPDASYPENPNNRFVLHWLQPNFTQSDNLTVNSALTLPNGKRLINETAPVVPYRRPSPPTNSSAHRYILYAWHQPANFVIPAEFSGFSETNRTRFNLTRWVLSTQLGTPAAANYFYTTNQSAVPANFVAGPNASYPNGNGTVITSGDPFKPTGSTASPSATTTGAAAKIAGAGSLVAAGLVGLAALL